MPKIKPKKKVLPKKKAPKAKKKDTALVGATEEISESTQKDIEASSNLPSEPPKKKLKKVDVSKFLPKKHEEAAQTSSVKLKKKQEDTDTAEETPEPPKPKK